LFGGVLRVKLKTRTALFRFVFFKTQQAAAIASQTLVHGEDNREFLVMPAPGPEEVNWSALWMSYKDRIR
jgi:hypothetical protein